MEMPRLAVGEGVRGTVGTGNCIRGKVLGPIQRDRETARERAVGLQRTQPVDGVHDVDQQRREFLRGIRPRIRPFWAIFALGGALSI
jgi:hypothetical protein